MTRGSNEPGAKCHQCGSGELRVAPGYAQMGRVTSDCKPWPAGGVLALCETCGLVQTIADPQWQKDSEAIYKGYAIYHQSGGVEQAVFDARSGAGTARSDAIVTALLAHVPLPGRGRWLDIGCGNGALLRACSRALPDWSLCGSEVSDKYRSVVEGIRGVERLFTGSLDSIPGRFDAVSMIHVIEHIPGPGAFLQHLGAKLNPGGFLLLEVPDCRKNFFSMMTADHCSHFSAAMLANVVASAGYEVLQAVDSWVSKEVTVVARAAAASPSADLRPAPLRESEEVFAGWKTLQHILKRMEPLVRARQFGIFGSSIAATWLDAQTGNAAKFFVDEDPSRIGKQHFGRPIVSPEQIPDGASVFVALPPAVAARLAARLETMKPSVHFVSP